MARAAEVLRRVATPEPSEDPQLGSRGFSPMIARDLSLTQGERSATEDLVSLTGATFRMAVPMAIGRRLAARFEQAAKIHGTAH